MVALGGTISRIKWKSVLSLIVVVAVIYFLATSIPSGYSIKNNIGLKVTADPDEILPGGTSVISVEVKNLNNDQSVTVGVTARTSDQSMFFTETSLGEYRKGGITIGPQETRRLRFEVKSRTGALEGRYGVSVSCVEDGKVEGTEDTVFVEVSAD